jgi:hypothetical protein
VNSKTAAQPPALPPTLATPGTEAILTLVGGVLAGVASVFVGTSSVIVTLIATIAAVLLAAMVLAPRR